MVREVGARRFFRAGCLTTRRGAGPAILFLLFRLTPPHSPESNKQQALVLTHEEEAVVSTVPYLSIRLRPLQALEIFGRCAKRAPVCEAREAVFCFWRDRAFGMETTKGRSHVSECTPFGVE